MILNFRIFKNLFLISFCVLALLGISACGKLNKSRLENKNLETLISAAQITLINSDSTSFPLPDIDPVLKYTPVSTVFPNPLDITNATDLNGTLEKLRSISSLTKEYHQELINIASHSSQLDFSHLVVIVDASYFPFITAEKMIEVLNDSTTCEKLTTEQCNIKISKVKSNLNSANEFGQIVNLIIKLGSEKLISIDTNTAFSLLYKLYPLKESSEPAFNTILSHLNALTGDEKLAFINLAIKKQAINIAFNLARDWFLNDSDKSSDSLKELALSFEAGELRDQLILASAEKIEKITDLELQKLTQLCSNPTTKDTLINISIPKISNVSSAIATDLIRMTSNNKTEISQKLILKINNFSATDLIFIAKNAAYAIDRESIILANLTRISSFSIDDVYTLALISPSKSTEIILSSLSKISNLDGNGLTNIVSAINSGPGRDKALMAGIPLITTSDVKADIAGLNLAYNNKLQISDLMMAKTPNLSSSDVALIAKNCQSASNRDQIIIDGTNLISFTTLDGVIALIGLSTNQKTTTALMNIARIPNVSTDDVGAILKTIADGPTRDAIIESGLGLIKQFSSNGAAIIVDRSFESKVKTATTLIRLIPNPTGTDLDKILAVCGSGNTRDLILSNGIKLLNKLTRNEAKSLYARAYDDKEHVAILLMSKVDDIDGTTIGEMALLSNKGSTRDLIITEGLKRLKKVDTAGLISMLKASDKLVEKLLMETTSLIENFAGTDAIAIANVINNFGLKDKFLIHSIDIIATLDEPTITQLALKASTQSAREEIVQKGIDKLGGGQ